MLGADVLGVIGVRAFWKPACLAETDERRTDARRTDTRRSAILLPAGTAAARPAPGSVQGWRNSLLYWA